MGVEKFGDRFFCPLLPGFSKKLLVPQEIAKNIFVDENRQTVTLVTHNGKIYHLKIYKEIQDHYIGGKGWKNYVNSHCLEDYDVLVFRYRGNMVFTLRIFDKLTCCEKIYSYSSHTDVKENIFLDSDDDEISNVVQKKLSESFCKKREVQELSYTSKHKVALCSQDRVPANMEENYSRKFSFEGTIRTSNIGKRMYIPSTFKKSTGLDKQCEVTLIDPKGRCWTVGVVHSPKHNFTMTDTYLARGWKEFVISNGLRVGDKCIFELLSEENSNIVIRVDQIKSICGGDV